MEFDWFSRSKNITNSLDDHLFADITFERITVSGDQSVEDIHENAFGRTAQTIPSLECNSCFIKKTLKFATQLINRLNWNHYTLGLTTPKYQQTQLPHN